MIESLEYHIVDHCNLNCAGCSHFSPLAEHWFVDPEAFERDYDILKNKFKDVNENKIVIVLSYLDKNKNVKLNVTNKMERLIQWMK